MTDALLGAQGSATCNVAIGVESTSGVEEAAPGVYMIMGGDITPVPKKPAISRDIAGQIFPSLAQKGIEGFEIPLPMLPVIEDGTGQGNGLGELLLCLFGADATDALVADHAYEHTFSWEDLIKTFTLWMHYATDSNEKVRMAAIDSLDLSIKADGSVGLDFRAQGANLWDVLDTDYGTEDQPDLATAKQVTGLGARLEFGQPGAAVRDAWEEITLSMKRNLSYGAPGKDGQHPAGSGSPRIVTTTKSNFDFGIVLRDLDREEIKRAREGVNTAPTASRQNDTAGLVKARLSIFGGALYAGLNVEADYCNAGTLTATVGGSYSGGTTVTVWEVQIKQGTPDQYRFRSTTGTGWSAWSSYANITGGADALDQSVTITFSSTTAGAEGDKFYVCSHYRYMLRVTIPNLAYKDAAKPSFSGGVRKADIELYHTSQSTAYRPTLDLWCSKSTAFS